MGKRAQNPSDVSGRAHAMERGTGANRAPAPFQSDPLWLVWEVGEPAIVMGPI